MYILYRLIYKIYLQRKLSHNEKYSQKNSYKLSLLIMYNTLDMQTMKFLENLNENTYINCTLFLNVIFF